MNIITNIPLFRTRPTPVLLSPGIALHAGKPDRRDALVKRPRSNHI